jgi:hypothetical protein
VRESIWPPRLSRETALEAMDALLVASPDSVEVRFNRAHRENCRLLKGMHGRTLTFTRDMTGAIAGAVLTTLYSATIATRLADEPSQQDLAVS